MANKKKKVGFTLQIIIALTLGVLLGWRFPNIAFKLSFLGEIFMAALKMLIMPLIVVTMVSGVSSLKSPDAIGRLGSRTVLYYLSTTALAVVVGLIVVNWMRPGEVGLPKTIESSLRNVAKLSSTVIPPSSKPTSRSKAPKADRGQEIIRNAFQFELLGLAKKQTKSASAPSSKKIQKLSEQAAREIWSQLKKTKLKGEERQRKAFGLARAEWIFARIGMRRSLAEAEKMRAKSKKTGPTLTVSRFLRMQIKKILQNPFRAMANGNILAVIVFSLILGLILVTLGKQGEPALTLARSLNTAMMKFVEFVMKMTPIGVFSLIAVQIARSGLDVLLLLGKYMLCVVLGLGVHAFLVLPLVLFVSTRRSPLRFFMQVRDALGVAFSTSSSSATLPVSMEVAEQRAEIRPHVSGFVLPLGSTVNMDGTALYEAVAALFIAQIYGIDLGLGPQILIFLTAALAAIGAAGIPSAGTVTMVMVLNAVGLPLSGIGLILAVDRLLDMCRTTVNVWGDLIGASVMDRYEPPETSEDPTS